MELNLFLMRFLFVVFGFVLFCLLVGFGLQRLSWAFSMFSLLTVRESWILLFLVCHPQLSLCYAWLEKRLPANLFSKTSEINRLLFYFPYCCRQQMIRVCLYITQFNFFTNLQKVFCSFFLEALIVFLRLFKVSIGFPVPAHHPVPHNTTFFFFMMFCYQHLCTPGTTLPLLSIATYPFTLKLGSLKEMSYYILWLIMWLSNLGRAQLAHITVLFNVQWYDLYMCFHSLY